MNDFETTGDIAERLDFDPSEYFLIDARYLKNVCRIDRLLSSGAITIAEALLLSDKLDDEYSWALAHPTDETSYLVKTNWHLRDGRQRVRMDERTPRRK